MSFSIEYLVTIESKGGFCDSTETFNNLLRAYSEIKIKKGIIIFKKIEVGYVITTDEIENQEQRFFHICLTIKNIEDEKLFLELLKMFRDIIYKANGKINVLWDDLSAYYSDICYPLIHRTENLLRKLISKFMLINLGMEWSAQTLPSEVQKSIKNKRSQAGITNILHDVDFIQLSEFLFKPYQTKSLSSLYDIIKKIETDPKFDNKNLIEYIPKSNWERYFSDLVDCSDTYLSKKWEKLYDLRCLIAHNTVISRNDFIDVQNLCKEIDEKFIEAINDLEKVEIPDADVEVLHENIASNLNELNGEFLENWKTLQSYILNLLVETQELTEEEGHMKITASSMMKLVEKYKVIDIKIMDKVSELRSIRHQVVHESANKISEEDLKLKIQELKNLCDEIKSVKQSKTSILKLKK